MARQSSISKPVMSAACQTPFASITGWDASVMDIRQQARPGLKLQVGAQAINGPRCLYTPHMRRQIEGRINIALAPLLADSTWGTWPDADEGKEGML